MTFLVPNGNLGFGWHLDRTDTKMQADQSYYRPVFISFLSTQSDHHGPSLQQAQRHGSPANLSPPTAVLDVHGGRRRLPTRYWGSVP